MLYISSHISLKLTSCIQMLQSSLQNEAMRCINILHKIKSILEDISDYLRETIHRRDYSRLYYHIKNLEPYTLESV